VKRGEIYLVKHPTHRDPMRRRAFVVVSRQILIESRFATVVCAPIFTTRAGLETQVPVGVNEGLKHDSAVHCDELVSLPKAALTNYLGALSGAQVERLNRSLKVALAIED
jgi:mRNA interferase MazF